MLLSLAAGTGKTTVAFQVCWKLWSAGWNARGDRSSGARSWSSGSPVALGFASFAFASAPNRATACFKSSISWALIASLADFRGGRDRACGRILIWLLMYGCF